MSVINAIKRARDRRNKKDWDKTFWLIDWHDTIAACSYDKNTLSIQFYPYALEVLQYLSARSDID